MNTFIRKNAETENGREKDRWTDMYTALKPQSVTTTTLKTINTVRTKNTNHNYTTVP